MRTEPDDLGREVERSLRAIVEALPLSMFMDLVFADIWPQDSGRCWRLAHALDNARDILSRLDHA